MSYDLDRVGYLTKEQFAVEIAAPVGDELAGTFQPLDATLTAFAALGWTAGAQIGVFTAVDTISLRSIGAASATDILDRAAGDGRYALIASAGVSSFNTRTGAVTLTFGDVTAALGFTPVTNARTISTTAPLTGGGDLSANRTLAISAATTIADGSMSAADKTKLDAISGTNTGDQTSIVGITGTKAQFDTAVTDGNILYVGDVTQYTDEMAQDAVGAMVDGTLVYVDATPLLTRAALTGDATAAQGSNAVTVVKINGVSLAGLATGILKNTTTTGAPSIAVAGDFPTLNQSTTGSAATLTTPRAIYGNNFDGSAALSGIIASTYGGTGNGFAKFTGPATAERTFTLPNADATLLYSGGAGGTPSSLTLTNATGLPIAGLVNSTSAALGLGTIELGHASDTTIARSGAGDITIEGNAVYRAGGTDVPVADGGTGRSTSTTAYGLIAAGTTATGAHQTLAAGATTEILVGGGTSALPVWTTATGTGAPVRAGTPTLTTPEIGAATGTSLVTTGAVTAKGDVNVWGGNGALACSISSNTASGGGYFAANGTNQNIRLVPTGTGYVQITTAAEVGTYVNAGTYLRCGSYTVATVPSASACGAGAIIYVSNETGGATTAFSDGTNWRRHADRAIIS